MAGKAFWSSLAGVLTGLAALITALVGVYSATHSSAPAAPPKPQPANALADAAPAAAAPAAAARSRASEHEPSPRARPRPAAGSLAATDFEGPALSIASLTGTWRARGAFRNGAPYSGELLLGPDLGFQMGAQGVLTAAGRWSLDPSSRRVALEGQHVLYGAPLAFRCTLSAEGAATAFHGTCTDATGTASLAIER